MWSQLIRADPLQKFQKSKFRRSFSLDKIDIKIVNQYGFLQMREHAKQIINKSLKQRPANDGRQTPYRGSPIFKAQHATAICCRKCIEKWHHIPRNKVLDQDEITILSNTIMSWIKKQVC